MVKRSLLVNKESGILIVCEGISASGKTMTIANLQKVLSKYRSNIKVIEWNSNKSIRKLVMKLNNKRLLTANIYSFLQWMSFTIDYVLKIKPLLRKDYIVIADRYIYTALTRDKANGVKRPRGNVMYKFIRKPDLLFYHNTSAAICYDRIKQRGKKLFYTNKFILSNSTLKNRDLYYLKILEREYESLFLDKKITEKTNIFYTGDNLEEVSIITDKYIAKKTSQEYKLVKSKVKEWEYIEL